jgi:signal transduction histidine kinase
MRQRVNRVAGNLAIESEPGSGTAICASVPVIAAARAGDAAGLAGETPVPARRTAPAGEAAT